MKTAIPTSNLGKLLREMRELRGFTQDEVAEHIGVKGSAISKWELGRSSPGPRYLELLRDFYGLTYTEMGLPALEGTRSPVKQLDTPVPQQVELTIASQPATAAPQPVTADKPSPQLSKYTEPDTDGRGGIPVDVQAAIDTILRMPWDARETVVSILRLSLERADYEKRLLYQLGAGGRQ